MEITSSNIAGKWKLCAFVSFMGCFILTLWQNNRNSNITIFLAFPNTTVTLVPSTEPSSFVHSHDHANEASPSCNIFEGRWVYKPLDNPSYNNFQCPFLSDQMSCQRNGRPDSEYQGWSWEAKDCEIPRFNGEDLLKRLTGKRMVIVGDSLNKNQWESLACLLYSSIPTSRSQVEARNGYHKIFKSKECNCSIEFYWSPFLMQFDKNNTGGANILWLDKIDNSVQEWREADIMVFNTGHWWNHKGKLKGWDFYQYKGELVKQMDIEVAFGLAMKTWAQWIDQNVDPTKTAVFFRSVSPEHHRKHRCYNVTHPITDNSYRNSFPKKLIEVLERTIKEMKTPVTYLNITKISSYRRDGHPTVYTIKEWKTKTKVEEQEKQGKIVSDCSHWCLPGVPDTWNRLLYALLVFNTSGNTGLSILEMKE